MNLLEILENATKTKHSVDELISEFEKVCEIPIQGEDEKMILFETGTYSFTGKPMFYFSLVRQYENEEEEYYQLHLDILFESNADNSSFQQTMWNSDIEDNIFDYIKKSKEYSYAKNNPVVKVDVFMDET